MPNARGTHPADQPGEGVETAPHLAFIVAQQRLAPLSVVEPGIHRFRGERRAGHRHHDTARKQRIDEGKRITDQNVAVSRDLPRALRIICRRDQRPDRLGIGHPLRYAGA
jgi:hypothetical protein